MEMLIDVHGEMDWIKQITDGVKECVQNGVERFSGSQAPGAATLAIGQGGNYRFPARTREEILASQQEAAQTRQTNRRASFEQLVDPTQENPDAEGSEQRHGGGPVQWLL